MIVSTISADVVDSTKLTKEGMVELRDSINAFISEIQQIDPSAWGRLTRGDFVECVVPRPEKALRIALLLKTHLKALDLPIIKDENSQLSVYGARIAIGIGTMRTIDRQNDVMDGEAIYLSGRQIDLKTPTTRGTLVLCAKDEPRFIDLNAICVLIDALVNKITSRQANVVYYKLLGMKVDSIAALLGITQSAVSQHAIQASWYAIEYAVRTFETEITKLCK